MNIAIIDDINADKLTIMQYINMYFSTYCSDMPLSIHTFDSGDVFFVHSNSIRMILFL